MSTHNLCFEQKYEKYQSFSSENFSFLVVKFSVYLNRRVFVMWFYHWFRIKDQMITFGNKEHVTDRKWESRFY